MNAPAGLGADLDLDPMEQRILGCLMEKQRTVPATYPLTLNAVRTACNQTSSRDPVVDYGEDEIEQCLRELRRRELVRVIVPDRGQRTLKYHQRLDERLELADDERAVLTVLMLRGPQSPGELKTRTERLRTFADREEVEGCLRRLAGRVTPLVRELDRQVGQHDRRWVHLLGPVAAAGAGPGVGPAGGSGAVGAAPERDLEAVLAGGVAARDAAVRAHYDAVALAGAGPEGGDPWGGDPAGGDPAGGDFVGGDFAGGDPNALASFEAWLLDRVARLAGDCPALDVGCGSGRAAARLAAAGVSTHGLDLSPGQIDLARRRHPAVSFQVGSFASLLRPPSAPAWSAVVAWYAIGHLAPSELGSVFAEWVRVLAPGGTLALAALVGDGSWHTPAGVGEEPAEVRHDPARIRSELVKAGLTVAEWYLCGTGAAPGPASLMVLARAT